MISYKAKRKGMTGILEIAQELYFVDRSENYMLDNGAFHSGLNRSKLELGAQEIDILFERFETTTRPGFLDYTDLINQLKYGGLNESRHEILQEFFAKLDHKAADVIDLRIMSNLFNARNHFDVKGGRRTQDEIDGQFKDALQIYSKISNGSSVVDYQGFVDFWSYLAPSVLKDTDFEYLARACFRFNELPNKGQVAGSSKHGKKDARIVEPALGDRSIDNLKTLG